MDRNGTRKKRLTFMSVRSSPESANKFRLAGSLSFISDETLIDDVITHSFGLVGTIVRVTIKPGCL